MTMRSWSASEEGAIELPSSWGSMRLGPGSGLYALAIVPLDGGPTVRIADSNFISEMFSLWAEVKVG